MSESALHKGSRALSSLAFTSALFFLGCTSSKPVSTQTPAINSGSLEVAKQLIDAGEFKKAIQHLRPLNKIDPKNTSVLMLLGFSYLGNGNVEASSTAFQQVTNLETDNYDAKLNLSYTYILRKKNREARLIMDKVIDDGSYAYMEKVHSNYGLSYLEEKRCDLAQKKFSAALVLDPTFVTAYFNSGKCWVMTKNFPAAVRSFKKAVDFCPGCVEPTLELAEALSLAGQKTEAVSTLEKMLNSKMDVASETKVRQLISKFKAK